jgi:hypothetical protein
MTAPRFICYPESADSARPVLYVLAALVSQDPDRLLFSEGSGAVYFGKDDSDLAGYVPIDRAITWLERRLATSGCSHRHNVVNGIPGSVILASLRTAQERCNAVIDPIPWQEAPKRVRQE